jgi:hypothetical protein
MLELYYQDHQNETSMIKNNWIVLILIFLYLKFPGAESSLKHSLLKTDVVQFLHIQLSQKFTGTNYIQK